MQRTKTLEGPNRQPLHHSIRHKLKREESFIPTLPFCVFPSRSYSLCWPVLSPHKRGARFRAAPFEMMSSSAEQRLKALSLERGGPRMLNASKSNRRTHMSEEIHMKFVSTFARCEVHSPGEDFLNRKEQVSSEV